MRCDASACSNLCLTRLAILEIAQTDENDVSLIHPDFLAHLTANVAQTSLTVEAVTCTHKKPTAKGTLSIVATGCEPLRHARASSKQ